MPSRSQWIIWRKQAADRLQHLILVATRDDLQPSDAVADTLLRQLSNLPARPNDRAPYQGCFPKDAVRVARIKTVNRLKQLIINIPGDQTQKDSFVDDALRSLLKRPTRTTQTAYAEIFPETPLANLDVDRLLAIAPDADPGQVAALLPHLLVTMAEYKINTALRQAHFLAQLIHESGSFNYLEEIDPGDYLEDRLDLGNTEPGDGRRFKGRGLIQITGRNNYAACGQDLGVDLIKYPTRLSEHDLAALSAGWFWWKNDLNELSDRDDIELVTRTINGGLNGFDDRQYFLGVAKDVLDV